MAICSPASATVRPSVVVSPWSAPCLPRTDRRLLRPANCSAVDRRDARRRGEYRRRGSTVLAGAPLLSCAHGHAIGLRNPIKHFSRFMFYRAGHPQSIRRLLPQAGRRRKSIQVQGRPKAPPLGRTWANRAQSFTRLGPRGTTGGNYQAENNPYSDPLHQGSHIPRIPLLIPKVVV